MKSLIPILALCLTVGACKKATDVPSREDALRGGAWRQVSGTVTYRIPGTNKDSTFNYWEAAPECEKDNTLSFLPNFDGTLGYGANRCDQSEPSTANFWWELQNNDETLEINYIGEYFYGAEPLRAEIVEFSGNSMTLRYQIRDTIAPQTTPTTFTFLNRYTK